MVQLVSIFASLPVLLAGVIGIGGALPDTTHAWAVHDRNRPRPPVVALDEVGLVTTDLPDNDTYWTSGRFDNGTHTHNTIHIALGKNMERKGVVHSNLHMDMDIHKPTVSADGLVFIKDGKFVDSVIGQN